MSASRLVSKPSSHDLLHGEREEAGASAPSAKVIENVRFIQCQFFPFSSLSGL